ncbi:MAG TPA: hypothetical protein VJG64_02080 [Candidatus Paceibacterota bacterium]
MEKFNVFALANTLAIIDLILHPLFHLWISISPQSYEWLMHIFVAGLQLQVTEFDSSFSHIVSGTIVEAAAFWGLGAAIALIYNRLIKQK